MRSSPIFDHSFGSVGSARLNKNDDPDYFRSELLLRFQLGCMHYFFFECTDPCNISFLVLEKVTAKMDIFLTQCFSADATISAETLI